MKWFAALLVPLLVATVALGCGGDEGESPVTTPATTPEAAAEATGEATPGATSSPQAAATPEVTAEPTPTSQPAVDPALVAALEYFDAVSDADCQTNNPQNKRCVGLSSQPSTVQRGIAVFGVASPDGPGGFAGVLGRDPAGEWKFWRAGQQDYQLLTLPGDALVCAYGSRLNVRSEPTTDAPAVGVMEDLTAVRAEEFVLTEQGSDLQQGHGWFRLSSPLDGWVYSKYLTAALWDDCALHDALEPEF